METVHLQAHADEEGHLRLDLPESMRGRNLAVTVTVQPDDAPCDANGWPVGFKERFLGAFPDFPDIEDEPARDVEPL